MRNIFKRRGAAAAPDPLDAGKPAPPSRSASGGLASPDSSSSPSPAPTPNRSWPEQATPSSIVSSTGSLPSPSALTSPGFFVSPTEEQFDMLCRFGRERRKAYRDIAVLGTGTEGAVKLALAVETRKQVALKSIVRPPKSPERERDIRRRFLHIQAHAGHPFICEYLEFFEVPDKLYIVTEFCAGGELSGYVQGKGGRLGEDEARKAVEILLKAVAYVHRNSIVHRDLKPANVLLRKPGDIESLCVADFGEAFVPCDDPTCAMKHSHYTLAHSALTTIVGTPFYLAPEIVNGQPYSHNVDIWSVGCMAYELLEGRTPFATAPSFLELFRRIRSATFEPPRASPEAQDFVSRLLDPDPARRPSAVEALKHPWITGSGDARSGNRLSGSEVFFRRFTGQIELVSPTVETK